MDRRNFIVQLAAAAGATGLWGAFAPAASGEMESLALPDAFREIDHNTVTHQIRDGHAFPSVSPRSEVDVVIVGGGISGLTALHHLSGAKCLLLEKEKVFGGNSRRLKANGIHYPLGAILSQGAVEPFTAFFKEIGVEFFRVRGPETALRLGARTYADPFGTGAASLPYAPEVRKAFADFPARMQPHLAPKTGIDYPKADNTAEVKALNGMTLKQRLEKENPPAELVAVLNLFLQSRVGSDWSEVCAWEGLYILARATAPMYTLPGGHGAVTDRLLKSLKGRKDATLKPGATVVRVEPRDGGGAHVTWIDGDTGRPECVKARCVVMASPKLISKHVIQGLPEERAADFRKYRYTPFLVAQVFLRKPISDAYETIAPGHFSKFLVRPDWIQSNRSPTGHGHLTVYVPFPGPAGRAQLLADPPLKWARQIHADLKDIFGDEARHVLGMHLHRWGHPMVVPSPGMDAWVGHSSRTLGDIVFAHSDSYGISGLYSAVWTGMDAYTEATLRLEA